jgi:hypothetical protein
MTATKTEHGLKGHAVKHFDIGNRSTKRERVGFRPNPRIHSLARRACIAGRWPAKMFHSVARRSPNESAQRRECKDTVP